MSGEYKIFNNLVIWAPIVLGAAGLGIATYARWKQHYIDKKYDSQTPSDSEKIE